ncbi:MAG: nicotinamide mononucleotide transporter [Ruminococcaceae bacterium]|nr:nicotinamide mononucleotide transporter [Oscillospiraceae bacterium]
MALTKFEKWLWVCSLIAVVSTFFIFGSTDYLTLIASLIGVTALIFLAKGHAVGQILIIIFSVFYGIISIKVKYYGEAITYLGMTAPMAVVALISWLRHPFKDTKEVEIHNMTKKQTALMLFFTVIATVAFYFILKKLGNASLAFSTLSITTSFLASYMTAMRSPYYALGYAANDLVLIVLWITASINDISSVAMVACFLTFFFNDLYGFINWKKMEKKQKSS